MISQNFTNLFLYSVNTQFKFTAASTNSMIHNSCLEQVAKVGKTVTDWMSKEFPDYHFVSPPQTINPEESILGQLNTIILKVI